MLLTERKEDGREGVMWMSNILPELLPGPATISMWPEILGSVCGFQRGAVCFAGEAEPKARGALDRIVHMIWAGFTTCHHRNPEAATISCRDVL